jgi:hypothetical protein
MTNYSFDPPAKKAMDEAELSELISAYLPTKMALKRP